MDLNPDRRPPPYTGSPTPGSPQSPARALTLSWEREGHGTEARLVKAAEEQAVLKRMAGLRKRGRSYRAIADKLNADSVPAKGGGAWVHTAVASALRRHGA